MSKGGWYGRFMIPFLTDQKGKGHDFYKKKNAWINEATKVCHLCGKPALYKVGIKGYCKAHKEQAIFDRTHARQDGNWGRTDAVEAIIAGLEKGDGRVHC